MKIAFVSPDDLSTIIFCRTFAAVLKELGGFDVFTIGAVGPYRAELAGVASRHIAVDMERFVQPVKDLRYILALYRIFRRERFDLVVTFTTKPNIYGALAARRAGVPGIVVAVRGLGQTFNDARGARSRALHFLVRRLYRASCRASHRVWFTNPNDRAYFVSHGLVDPEKTFVTRNAIDLQEFSMGAVSEERLRALRSELGLSADSRVVVMVARMIWPKGVREFAEAARLLRDRNPSFKFLLVAPLEPDSQHAIPESYIRQMERQGNLAWLGFRKDVRDLYALAHLAVLPSYYKEGGYPRALLEPMALGKPVIAADTDDCKGPVEEGKNGFLVPARDPGALADRIERILSDDEMRERFGRYSLEKMRREFDDRMVVRQVLAELSTLFHKYDDIF